MKGICALYDIETELLESHIYPKFVINYTKKTGGKYLRRFAEPNKRLQDGIKLYLLGEKAEQEFAQREKWFAENIFLPYLAQKLELSYDKNLYYFAVSFLWRILILELRNDSEIKNKWYYQTLIKAEQEWKSFLVKGIKPKTFENFCLFFTDRVKHNNSDLNGTDFYFRRIMDATIVDNAPHSCLLVYGKFNRFIFWSVLKNYGGEKKLSDVEIKPDGGIFSIPQKIDYFPIISFFGNRIREIDKLQLPSDNQQKKIESELLKDPVAFWESDLGQSLLNDITFNGKED